MPHSLNRRDDAAARSPFEPLLHLARLAKGHLRIPVIGVGGIKTRHQAEEALEQGFADLVAAGKAILADPGWARKVLDGREEEIAPCTDCKPRCYHFTEPERCPARKKLRRRE